MQTTTQHDLETGITTIRLAGELNQSTLAIVRRTIGKAAAECPTGVIVDLAALRSAHRRHVGVLAAATHQAQETWGVPVLWFAAEPQLRRDLRVFDTFMAIYDYQWQAVTAVRADVPRWIRHRLAPTPANASTARRLLGDACLTWNLGHLRDDAQLIAAELAANAINHAATTFEVTAGYARCYLRIGVRDGSPALPQRVETPSTSGRGIRIVEALSTHWGATSIPGGKIVWALIRTER
jgi:anti-anti-sigma regulatory factor